MINNSSGVLLPVFKYLNIYVPKSTMGVVDPLKCPSSVSMMWSENFQFNPNYVNISHPKIISYLPLAESYTWHFHVTAFVALSAVKVKYMLTLRLVLIFTVWVFHCTTESFSGFSLKNIIPIKIVELYPLSYIIRKF